MFKTVASLVVCACVFGASLSHDPSSRDRAGGANCNVTAIYMHTCAEQWFSPGTGCNVFSMVGTTAVIGDQATYREIASNDNCNNYNDSAAFSCENWANEPTTPDCYQHTWGLPF